jgi:hypothetical protein
VPGKRSTQGRGRPCRSWPNTHEWSRVQTAGARRQLRCTLNTERLRPLATFHGLFNLRPPTLDRPFFTGVLPLARLGTILERVALVPHEELAWLVNLAVLLQALALDLVGPQRIVGTLSCSAGQAFRHWCRR